MPQQPTSSSHSVGRQQTAAACGQGRGARAPAAAAAASLDGALTSGGYAGDNRKKSGADIDFARIRRLVPLSAVLARYGILRDLKRVGSQLRGPCPLHQGSNPQQFVVNADESTWHCFGDCHAGGGTLEFVAAIEGVPIARAATLIADWFALADTGRAQARKHRRKTMHERPSHKAFVVENRDGDEEEQGGFWHRIGSAWPHKDGKGLNIVLSAFPVGGRIVLREYTAEDQERDEKKASQRSP